MCTKKKIVSKNMFTLLGTAWCLSQFSLHFTHLTFQFLTSDDSSFRRGLLEIIVYHLHNIGRIRKYLSYDDRKSIVQAVIMSRIDYCNSLMVGVPAVQLSKLQRLENAAARLVSNVAKYDHITPTLVKLHWLPVRLRVIFKMAMLAHKYIYGNAPEYLRELVKVKKTSRYNLRSDGGMLLEDYSARSKKILGDRAFTLKLRKP